MNFSSLNKTTFNLTFQQPTMNMKKLKISSEKFFLFQKTWKDVIKLHTLNNVKNKKLGKS